MTSAQFSAPKWLRNLGFSSSPGWSATEFHALAAQSSCCSGAGDAPLHQPAPGRARTGRRRRTTNIAKSLHSYFLAVTIIAAFNAILTGAAALRLGVPLAGTIAVVTFVGAYVPSP